MRLDVRFRSMLLALALWALAFWGSPARALTYNGYVDALSEESIAGWACAVQASATLPAWVHVYDGSSYLFSAPANSVLRPDAAPLCSGKKWVGFQVATPKLSFGSHTLNIFVSDTKTPSTVNRLPGATALFYGATFTGPSPFGVIESITPTTISGWACDTNAPSSGIGVHVYVQHHGSGAPRFLASGTTTLPRADVAGLCGSGASKGFSIALPALPGGNHNVIAFGINVGAGQNAPLSPHDSVPATTSFPYAASKVLDPNLSYASTCWLGRLGIDGNNNLSSCPPDTSWQLDVTQTYGTSATSVPLSPLSGPNARLRYAKTNPSGGFSMLVNTWDTPAAGQILNRCDYNYQGIKTNIQEFSLAGKTRLDLEAIVSVQDDGGLRFEPLNASDGSGCANAIESGRNPWMHTIVAAVFRTQTAPARTYYIELVPFWLSGPVTGSYPSYADFPGNAKPMTGNLPAQFSADNPTQTGGGIGGPAEPGNYALSARVATTDERIRDFILAPSPMALGETRTLNVDLLRVFRALYPGVDTNGLYCTGAYVGTEQFNKGRIGLDVRRLSLIAP